MTQDTFVIIFKIMIGLYFLASVIPISLWKKHRLSNISSNILCFLASILGIYLSFVFFLNKFGELTIIKYDTVLKYIVIDIRLDGISSFFMLALSILVSVVSLYSIGYVSQYYGKKPVAVFNFLYSTFILSMLMVIVSGNMIIFYISWEIMSLSSYFLVTFESANKEARNSSTLYIIMTHIGTSFLLLAFIITYVNIGSFDIATIGNEISSELKNVLFLMYLIGFGTKAGVVPLHIWLPYAHPVAPSNVSALMSGIMIKIAIYGLVRFIFDVLTIENTWWGIIILFLGIISTITGVTYAYIVKNIKKLLAFSSIENIGIILMGLGIAAIAISEDNLVLFSLALMASMAHMFNHSIFKCLLFLNAGSVYFATHTKNMNSLGGLIKTMPATGILAIIGGLSISAIIPFNGFISEWLTYQSFFMMIGSGNSFINIVAILAVVALAVAGALTIGIYVKYIGIVFLGEPRSESAKNAKEVPKIMVLSKGVLAAICFIIGIFPLFLLKLINIAFTDIGITPIINSFTGTVLVPWYPVSINDNQVTPIFGVLVFILVILLILLSIRILVGRAEIRKFGTWDCGFGSLNNRMQYSATGYSDPIENVLRMIYKPHKELRIEKGPIPYHPKEIKYILTTEHLFEKYLYMPIIRISTRLSKKIRFRIQTGSIHLYLLYIFLIVYIFLIYNRLYIGGN